MKMDKEIYHTYSCSQEELIKEFVQIRPYYEGSEILMRIYYCPECGSYTEVDYEEDTLARSDI